ncbi:activator of Hsp90 ATPase [Umbelopsis sp. PMI_123]|nr:activator of Hsp90 ATPase [Umbelopsis sp. PMI_123]
MSNWKNVNNWVNKNCLNWAQTYFRQELAGIEAEKNGIKASVTKVTDVNGDVDLNQRKGKIITIFDVEIKLEWKGSAPDGTEAQGRILIPEVAHDTDIDDYFEITVTDDSNAKHAIKEVVRKDLTAKLRQKLSTFAADLVKAHGADVYIDPSQLGTAAPPRAAHATKETSAATKVIDASATSADKRGKIVNTTKLEETVEFQTSAHELYETLLDSQRVAAWTRGSAKMTREVGGKFEFFNGNVSGEILECVPDKKIVQKWRLSTWPESHYSQVTFTFDQASDSTKLIVKQTGVPIGEEEITRRNWTGYYWNSIKQTFGFGAVF